MSTGSAAATAEQQLLLAADAAATHIGPGAVTVCRATATAAAVGKGSAAADLAAGTASDAAAAPPPPPPPSGGSEKPTRLAVASVLVAAMTNGNYDASVLEQWATKMGCNNNNAQERGKALQVATHRKTGNQAIAQSDRERVPKGGRECCRESGRERGKGRDRHKLAADAAAAGGKGLRVAATVEAVPAIAAEQAAGTGYAGAAAAAAGTVSAAVAEVVVQQQQLATAATLASAAFEDAPGALRDSDKWLRLAATMGTADSSNFGEAPQKASWRNAGRYTDAQKGGGTCRGRGRESSRQLRAAAAVAAAVAAVLTTAAAAAAGTGLAAADTCV